MHKGLLLAAGIMVAWVVCMVHDVFDVRLVGLGLVCAPVLVAVQCWLNVGLFIVAHDCMHGTLAPGRPALNRTVGRLCLLLYAGFPYARMRAKHMEHHAHSGTELDPDFALARFPAWFARFMRTYFGATEFFVIALAVVGAVLLGGARAENVAVFWGLPALLSAAQLFYFGTYLPHRPGAAPFADRHRARSNDYGRAVSLLTCFHFGYHHEHHARPEVAWYDLPEVRK